LANINIIKNYKMTKHYGVPT